MSVIDPEPVVTAMAPDRDKLLALADRLSAVELPTVSTPAAQSLLNSISTEIGNLCGSIRAGAKNLE